MIYEESTLTLGLGMICILLTVGFLLKNLDKVNSMSIIEWILQILQGWLLIFLWSAILSNILFHLYSSQTLLALIDFTFMGILISYTST